MRVDQLMTNDVETCSRESVLQDAAWIMWKRDCGCVPIIDRAGRVVGMITDRDICMAALIQGVGLGHIPVAKVATRKPVTIRRDETVEEAQRLMREHQVRRVPVVDADGKLVGLLSVCDLVRGGARIGNGGRHGLSDGDIAQTLAAVQAPNNRDEGKSTPPLARPISEPPALASKVTNGSSPSSVASAGAALAPADGSSSRA